MPPSLRDPDNFEARAQAIDALEFKVIAGQKGASEQMAALEAVNEQMFSALRAEIRSGLRGPALRRTIRRFVPSMERPRDDEKYDALDAFMTGLLLDRPLPEDTTTPGSEMVRYQRTPSRFVFDLVERTTFSDDDVFYDLGSGTGEVAIVVHLLTGVRARGIEVMPQYCEYARQTAAGLDLTEVSFVHDDARSADFSDGTIFFLYTPFTGSILADVMERIRAIALHRPVRVFTYGPCTAEVLQYGG